MTQPTSSPDRYENSSLETLLSPDDYQVVTEANIESVGQTMRIRSVDGEKRPLVSGEFKPCSVAIQDISNGTHRTRLLLRFINFDPKQPDATARTGDGTPPGYLFPVDTLAGLRSIMLPDGTEAVAFTNWKQEKGEEVQERVLIPTGFAWGVHPGHMGVPEKGIPAEQPGWYMYGTLVGNVQEGQFESIEPCERSFALARIVDGPVGDSRDPAFRAEHGIY